MAGAKPKRGGKRKVASTPAVRALGNDPFARGAAVRAAAPTPAAKPTPPPPRPPTRKPLAPLHRQLDDLEARLDAAMGEAEARLSSAAGEPGGGADRAKEDLRTVVETLWPAVRQKLAAAGDLIRLLEPPDRLDRFGMDPRLVERAAPLVELLYSAWWRVEARAIEQVPSDGPAVLVANHAGFIPWDALVLRHALKRDHPAHRDIRPLLDDAACDRPFIGGAAIRLGAVRASPEGAARLLADGALIGVFPEGTTAEAKPWRERYRIGRFGRGGFAKVALRAGAPIVPCAIVGSEEAAPAIARTGWLAEVLRLPLLAAQPAFRVAPAGLVPLPSRWSLRFGEPIPTASFGAGAAEATDVVADLAEQTRASLQAMLDEDVAARRSIFL
jgi:1-acyl-sn-glycerol-3-phosphate acyltransferase